MGGLSAKSKKKKRQNAIKRIILKPGACSLTQSSTSKLTR